MSDTAVGEGAFAACSGLTGVTIPDGVTTIGESAFVGCSSLETIDLPESVTSIGDEAFLDCEKLTKFKVDSANETYYSSRDGVLFAKDEASVTLILPVQDIFCGSALSETDLKILFNMVLLIPPLNW